MYTAEHAKEHPDQPLFIMGDSGIVVTYAQFEAGANRLAQLFRAQGLQRLDHVAFFMENNQRLLEAEGAAERTGLYFTCINSYLSVDEASYVVNDSHARVVVTSAAKQEVAGKLPPVCPNVERWLITDVPSGATIPAGFERYEEAVSAYSSDPVPDEQLGMSMPYSSGTTGRPKGILRPLPDEHPGAPQPVMALARSMFGFREGMTYLSPAPLFHSAPQVSVALTARLGAVAVIMERFDPVRFLDLVAEHKVTHTQMVPTMFSRLLKLPSAVREGADLSSLEWVVHAAAPCPVPIKAQMIDWFGPVIVEYYGATESNGFTWCDSQQWLDHPGTVGKTVYGEIHILDENGNECPPGAPGTVWFAGATNFEYFNAPAKTAESRDPTGTVSTVGDIGHVDDDGFLYLTDRKNHMIISGGVNIYPQETENLLITHPKVMDAAVIGIPNEDLGEAVKAVVQLVDGIEPGSAVERELIDFCAQHLARFKCPRSIDFEDELPRLPTGKLYKRLLRDRYWADRDSSIV
jgi:long-chain acyl-CoA synthetase